MKKQDKIYWSPHLALRPQPYALSFTLYAYLAVGQRYELILMDNMISAKRYPSF
jgi:hypothetical protein